MKIILPALCCAALAVQAAEPPTQTATAAFIDARGKAVGAATLKQTPHGVLIEAHLEGIPAGEHAFHIHETGKCDPASGFESAGDHFAPRDKQHGYMAEGGPHAGDMPNQLAAKNGMLHASLINPEVTLSAGPASLLDADGASLVVHAKRDDYSSQPSGDAGDRIACAVVKRADKTAAAKTNDARPK